MYIHGMPICVGAYFPILWYFHYFQQVELVRVQEEMEKEHGWMVQAAQKIQNIRDQKKLEQDKIDAVCCQ